MKCPKCGGRMGVVDTLPTANLEVWRRRKCKGCGEEFRTVEMVDNGTNAFSYGYSSAYAEKHERIKHQE